MCEVDASEEDLTDAYSTNERAGCFYNENDQFNQGERRGASRNATKTDCC